jgi:putative oxidoreductase
MESYYSYKPAWRGKGLSVIRIFVGLFMIYHGWEVFSAEKMNGYMDWEMFKGSSIARVMVYAGKIAELVAGIFLFIGLFTSAAALIMILTMAYIAFFVGHGKVWYEDQHPFLFVLLGMVFIFCGPGTWSIDRLRARRNIIAT